MNVGPRIRELVQATLSDDHRPQGVRFVDELLSLASAAGEITCTLANEDALRFQVRGEPDFEVQLGRAKSKLRMFCARLAVLCQESGCEDVSIYGGEGTIGATVPETSPSRLAAAAVGLTAPVSEPAPRRTPSPERPAGWAVRFVNTPDKQTFTVVKLPD